MGYDIFQIGYGGLLSEESKMAFNMAAIYTILGNNVFYYMGI